MGWAALLFFVWWIVEGTIGGVWIPFLVVFLVAGFTILLAAAPGFLHDVLTTILPPLRKLKEWLDPTESP